jgi:hypothetical protein
MRSFVRKRIKFQVSDSRFQVLIGGFDKLNHRHHTLPELVEGHTYPHLIRVGLSAPMPMVNPLGTAI